MNCGFFVLQFGVKVEAWYNVHMSNLAVKNKVLWSYPLLNQKGRLSVWQRAFGTLKNSKTHPIKELQKMRKEWDRKLPS